MLSYQTQTIDSKTNKEINPNYVESSHYTFQKDSITQAINSHILSICQVTIFFKVSY